MIMSQPLELDLISFYDDELACNFCVVSKNGTINNGGIRTISPCKQCIGLIFAIKKKQFFSVN